MTTGPDLPSTPWERAERWSATEDESTGIDDPAALSAAELIAKLGADRGEEPTGRRHRRAAEDDTETISAAAIIAALRGETAGDGTESAADTAAATAGENAADTAGESAAAVAATAGESAADIAASAGTEYDDTLDQTPSDKVESAVITAATADPADSIWAAPGSAAALSAPEAPAPAEPGVAEALAALAGAEPAQPEGDVIHQGPPGDEPPTHADGPARGWLTAARAFVAVVAVLLLLASGTQWVIKARADATLKDNTVQAIDRDDATDAAPAPSTTAGPVATTTAPAPVNYQAENILMIGSDSRLNAADQALGGHDDSPGGADVVMVAHMAADRSHVTIVSIPRDTYIKAPTCKAWDHETGKQLDQDYTTPYDLWRINATYAAGGPPCTVKAVQELTGLKIDRMIIIDFSGFRAMVDALGGITVNACTPIIDSNLGTVLGRAGKQHINGKQALRLVRARHVEGDTSSDLARIKRQQKVLSTILHQVTSAGVLLNPLKLDAVLQAFVSNVKSDNVTMDSMLDLAQSLGNLEPKRVTFFTLPTVPDSNGVGLHPAEKSDLIWEALRQDKALPGEVTDPPKAPATTPMTTITPDPVTSLVTSTVTTTPDTPQVLTVAPRDVDLQVVNVAGRGGVATQAKDALTPLGYQLISSDLLLVTDDTRSAVTVEYDPSNRDAALTVAATVPGSKLVAVDGLGSKVRLMLGSSFDGTVRAVAVGDALPSRLSTAASPEEREVVSTIVSTPPVIITPAPKPTKTTDLDGLELTSVNAGDAGCI